MSENKRSFWASVPGLVTGLAGLLTGIVGLITLMVQLNVIGGGKSKPVSTTATTAVGSPTTVAGGGGPPTTVESATFTVGPTVLDFPPSDPKEKVVSVRNTGRTSITVLLPNTDGENATAFTASLGTCGNEPLAAGLSCTVKVTFTPPSGILRRYNATLQVRAREASAGAEVKLTGSTVL